MDIEMQRRRAGEAERQQEELTRPDAERARAVAEESHRSDHTLRLTRAEHYEMAAYGTLVAWAQAMGHPEAANLLQQTLDEKKAADKKLSRLAEGGINQSAADAAHSDEDEEPVAVTAGGGGKRSSKSGRR